MFAKYTYDGLNRLIREDNAKLNKTYIFDYDGTGNITSKLECSFTLDKTESITSFTKTETYMYDGDRLIRTGSSNKSYYNANGKLTSYLGYPISFKEGGLISSYRSFSYEYDTLGRRTKKGSLTYTYNKDGLLASQSDGITFIYDHNSQMIGFKKDYSTYYFRKNLQGDIIALLDNSGNVVVRYYYDSWGNHKVCSANGVEITDTTHIGNLNPIRYRGYYYDKEFGLYYLKSRYYDPTIGRFITQDDVEYADYNAINGLNLYAYCNNNPVMYSDPSGNSWKSFWQGVRGFFQKVGDFIQKTFGCSLNIGSEHVTDFKYYGLASVESGVGYSRSFDNGKPVNFYLSLPDKWWKFWQVSVGFDVNIDGKGFGVGVGTENSFSIHAGATSLDFYSNIIGRVGVKIVQESTLLEHSNLESTVHSYIKYQLNGPEIYCAVVALKYGLAFLAALLKNANSGYQWT